MVCVGAEAIVMDSKWLVVIHSVDLYYYVWVVCFDK